MPKTVRGGGRSARQIDQNQEGGGQWQWGRRTLLEKEPYGEKERRATMARLHKRRKGGPSRKGTAQKRGGEGSAAQGPHTTRQRGIAATGPHKTRKG